MNYSQFPEENSGLDYYEDDREVDEGTAIVPQRNFKPVNKSQGPIEQPPRRKTSPRKPMYDFGGDSDYEDL